MGEKDYPKIERGIQLESVSFVVQVGFPTRIVLFLELALRVVVCPKSSYPRDSHVVFMWIKPGAGQVCRPAHPGRGRYPCQEQTPQ